MPPRTRTAAGSGSFPPVPANCVVTGGSGFVGQRLVEMLVERGAQRVVSFDIAPTPRDALQDARVVYQQGNLTKLDDVLKACEGADCVWHIAALVGPYYEHKAYYDVNYTCGPATPLHSHVSRSRPTVGTLNVIEACKRLKVRKIVMSSSPSTRFDGSDICGKAADELPIRPPGKFLQAYAETKAMGEMACRNANNGDTLLTVAIAPHQVYGPRDMLFLHNMLGAGNKLRIFGTGTNKCSFCHVDNYCHGLILGERALVPGGAALGKFYIVTDGPPQDFWRVLDVALVAVGCRSVFTKFRLPKWFILPVAYLCTLVGLLLRRKIKLNPFAARMLMIHRWFDIDAARRDLAYEPVIAFEQGWADTVEWFRTVWAPQYGPNRSRK